MNEQGGQIVAVSSQTNAVSLKAKKTWEIQFPMLGDPTCSVVNLMNERGWIDSVIEKKNGEIESMLGVHYEVGMLQPAVLGLDKNGSVLYTWSCKPGPNNINGAIGRPKPKNVWKAVQLSLSGDFSLAQGNGKINFSGPPMPMPVFWALLMAHGNFISPKPFIQDQDGRGDVMRDIAYNAKKLIAAGSICGVATLGGLVKAPKPTLALHMLYAIYFLSPGGPWSQIQKGWNAKL